jgi:hypothetical protein
VITVSQSSLSTAYVQVMVVPTSPLGYNPTNDVVQFAFILESYPETQPASGDYHNGSWAVFPGPQYWAQCLVGPGPGGVNLSQGLYSVWVKITDNPEIPVLQQVYLQITP